MIVYRTPTRMVDPGEISKLAVFDSKENIRRFLIHWGELEAALADEICPDVDEANPEIDRLRQLSLLAGKLFVRHSPQVEARLRSSVERILSPLKRPVRVSIPEGYAYYGLFPETYAESARKFYDAKWPAEVVCIGIRSIGTSLSAVASAALEERGGRVYSYTVRPHGHPFDRKLNIGPDLEDAWRALSHAYFVVIDEGPGLSGSSFAAVAQYISRLGVPDRRIVLLPSWTPSGEKLVSDRARAIWRRHEKYTAEPESGGCVDISAGKWRSIFYGDEAEYPAVQPQHEARKYLCPSVNGTALKKFAGLGLYGEWKLRRAQAFAEKGFCPPVIGLENGYLISGFVPGQPLSASSADPELLETMARYIAFRGSAFRIDAEVDFDDLARMAELNTNERLHAPTVPSRACIVDGRMLPHEWIATPSGYMKTDALDHGDNHFYPGPTDIAWDIAGAIAEFDLERDAREFLIGTYARLSGDRTIRARLPFFTAAYLAFRIGYTSMNELSKQAERYRALLERAVSTAA